MGHEAQYDPAATSLDGQDCVELCLQTNPTEEHRRAAAKLRREAAAHRRASMALRAAEQRSCAGIPDEVKDLSPFFYDHFILGAQFEREDEVVVHFRAVEKSTTERLQDWVDCHLARNAALGYDNSHMPFCPLAVQGVSAEVRSTSAGFDIVLTASSNEAMRDVSDRVRDLVGQSQD